MSLPLPDGALMRFQIEESPIMAPELAAKFPEIKTFIGRGVDETAMVRFDRTTDAVYSGLSYHQLQPNLWYSWRYSSVERF